MTSQCLDGPLELVGDVELVGVKEEQNAVDSLGKPLDDTREVIAAVPPLFLATRKQIRKMEISKT